MRVKRLLNQKDGRMEEMKCTSCKKRLESPWATIYKDTEEQGGWAFAVCEQLSDEHQRQEVLGRYCLPDCANAFLGEHGLSFGFATIEEEGYIED